MSTKRASYPDIREEYRQYYYEQNGSYPTTFTKYNTYPLQNVIANDSDIQFTSSDAVAEDGSNFIISRRYGIIVFYSNITSKYIYYYGIPYYSEINYTSTQLVDDQFCGTIGQTGKFTCSGTWGGFIVAGKTKVIKLNVLDTSRNYLFSVYVPFITTGWFKILLLAKLNNVRLSIDSCGVLTNSTGEYIIVDNAKATWSGTTLTDPMFNVKWVNTATAPYSLAVSYETSPSIDWGTLTCTVTKAVDITLSGVFSVDFSANPMLSYSDSITVTGRFTFSNEVVLPDGNDYREISMTFNVTRNNYAFTVGQNSGTMIKDYETDMSSGAHTITADEYSRLSIISQNISVANRKYKLKIS